MHHHPTPLVLALFAGLAATAYGLVNPSLQPPDLAERHKAVLVLTVGEIDDDAATLTLDVKKVVKGEFAAKKVLLRVDGETATEAFNEVIEPGQTIVAYVGKTGRRGADEILFYVADGRWSIGKIEGESDPQPWRWIEDLGIGNARSMFGTFNGSSARLAEMMEDAAAGRAYYPAEPFTKFKPDREIAKLSGTVTGVALRDLDGDGSLDIYASAAEGGRLFLQKQPLEFTDATEERGLKAAGGPSVSVADVNGDGRPDLLLGGAIWLATESGFEISTLLPKIDDVKLAAFAEIDGDGWPDVVVSRAGGGLRVYLHPGKNGEPYTDATEARGLADIEQCKTGNGFFFTGDWNGDGRPDLFYSVGKGLLLTQDKAGRFTPVEDSADFDFTTGGKEAGRTGAGSMAGLWQPDSTDMAFAFEASVNYVINRDGEMADATPYGNEITEGELGLVGTIAEDLNADGHMDIYALNGAGNTNVFYLNRGYGSFMVPHKYQNDLFPGPAHSRGSWAAAAGDVDRDGANDLVLGGMDGTVTLVLNDTLSTRRKAEHPTTQQRIQDATVLLSVTVQGNRGVCGAMVSLVDTAGTIVGRRVLGSQIVTGSSGPACVNLATRQPGKYVLEVRYADGLNRTQPVDLTQPGQHAQVTVTRGEEKKEK